MGTKLIMLKKEVSENEFIARNPGDDQLCILDIETTGFDPEDAEIVEIFILKVKNNKIVDEFYSLTKESYTKFTYSWNH